VVLLKSLILVIISEHKSINLSRIISLVRYGKSCKSEMANFLLILTILENLLLLRDTIGIRACKKSGILLSIPKSIFL